MIQLLKSEIEKEVDYYDLMYLTRDEAVYVAKCLSALVHGRHKKAEQYQEAINNDNMVKTVWHKVVENI